MRSYIKEVIKYVPSDWLRLTTHRLDIYNEERAKTQFIEEFEALFDKGESSRSALAALPTAYDYIRLGHPLSCVLEWVISKSHGLSPQAVISFASKTTPILAVLRKNHLDKKKTLIAHVGTLPTHFDPKVVHDVYGYSFETIEIEGHEAVPEFEGSTVFVSPGEDLFDINLSTRIDFFVKYQPALGSVILVNGEENTSYISEIQHVRRRESIAMTPVNCLVALEIFIREKESPPWGHRSKNLETVLSCIQNITGANTKAVVGSSGLSIQYAIVMGLIHNAVVNHPGHPIKLLVPPNCYGGTNDQARRVAACIDNVEVVDLPVDREHDMADSVDKVLDQVAKEDGVPLIIVEIPTNPRVEVPDLEQLRKALIIPRQNAEGKKAIEPVFILDQTFCPNYHFLGEGDILSDIQTISYVSGSKFPSGGLCTAGYCVANKKAEHLMDKIDLHLKLCDNEATDVQVEVLAQQMPSMLQRIKDAYKNTRDFVDFIEEKLPEAKINFVPQDLADRGFTPSVFSLDLPTKGESNQEREMYKRHLNHKLITMMITEIPEESKYCVSYGQLKGCYWTIPATSTQGTTKEEDKDYIARVSCSPNMDMEKHKAVFLDFVAEMKG